MNYFEHHIGDYDQATAHLSAVEDGIYHRLIRLYMAKEKPLSADVSALQRLVRAHSRDEKAAVQTVLSEFFELREDGYHQHRCDEEIARFQDKSAKAKRSAAARWNGVREESNGNANAHANASPEHDAIDMRSHSEGNAPRARPQTPDTRHQPSSRATGVDRRGSRLPQDWRLTPELEAYCRQERPDLDPLKTAERFRDFWHAKAGRDAAKLDWGATWRNWVRNEKSQPQGRQGPMDIFG